MIFAFADFGKNCGIAGCFHTELGADSGIFNAQKRVGCLFQIEARWHGWKAVFTQFGNGLLACGKRGIIRVNRPRKGGIGNRIFMAAINDRLVR